MERKFDDAFVLATFARLKNGRAVSREIGLHENTVYQVLRRHGGVCVRCQGKPVLGKTSCQKCLDFDKARIKQERARRRRAGVCLQCEGPRSPLSNMYCEAHRVAAADRSARYDGKRRALRGSPQGEAQSLRQKMRKLLETFGQAGRDRWNHAQGACEVCDTKYGDEAIHVHHIDEDRSNNTFENLICLCHTCHTAAHVLLRLHDRRQALLDWVAQTYPVEAPSKGMRRLTTLQSACPRPVFHSQRGARADMSDYATVSPLFGPTTTVMSCAAADAASSACATR